MRHSSRFLSITAMALAAGYLTKAPADDKKPEPPETKKPVSISIGVPTLWTVEEANYLLGQMRAGNADLATKKPSTDDLNPNAINFSQLQVIRSLLSVDVSYNQAAGVRNSMMLQQYSEDAQRKRVLQAMHDSYVAEQLSLEEQISSLNTRIADLTIKGAPDNQIKALQAALDARKTQLSQAQDQLKATDDELSKLNTTPPTFDSPGLPAQSNADLPPAAFDDVLKKLADDGSFLRDPKLQSSQVLDNYIQMQYQIISRQLSLLRDEAGREDRLVFLEVPTGIYAAPGPGDGKAVQVRWEAIRWGRACNPWRLRAVAREGKEGGEAKEGKDDRGQDDFLSNFAENWAARCPDIYKHPDSDAWVWEAIEPVRRPSEAHPDLLNERLRVRAVEMVPQQASVNVDQFYGKSTTGIFGGVASFLMGFGAQAKYKRQNDLAQRYIGQETHTSAFGKGSNLFGWNFNQLPTEKRLGAGERTTYAALAVPKDAVAIELHGTGCYSRQGDLPPAAVASQASLIASAFNPKQCVERTAVVYIPSARDMHPHVLSLGYKPTAIGQRATVTLHGARLSRQTSILVNGVELRREVSLGQSAAAPSEVNGVSGSFEYVSPEFMVMSFSVRDATTQPVITLIGPGFTQNLEYKSLWWYVAGENSAKHCNDVPLFYAPIAISGLKAAAVDAARGDVSFRMEGASLRKRAISLVNSKASLATVNCGADSFCEVTLHAASLKEDPAVNAATWTLEAAPTDELLKEFIAPVEATFPNPLLVRFDQSAAPMASWTVKDGSSAPEKLRIEASLAGLDGLAYQIDGKDVRPSAVAPPDKATFEIDPPAEGIQQLNLRASRPGTMLMDTVAVKLPARPTAPVKLARGDSKAAE